VTLALPQGVGGGSVTAISMVDNLRTSIALGSLEDCLDRLDEKALEALLATNEQAGERLKHRDDYDYFCHIVRRQKLILFFLLEWKGLMATRPPEPESVKRFKNIMGAKPS